MTKCFFKSDFSNSFSTYAGRQCAKDLAARFYEHVKANMVYESYDGICEYTGNRKFRCTSHLPAEVRFETGRCKYYFGFENEEVFLTISPKAKA